MKKKDSFDELSLASSPTREKTNVFLSEAELEESCIKSLENISKTIDTNLFNYLENYEKTHFTRLPISQRIRYATPVGEFKVIIEELMKTLFDIKKRIRFKNNFLYYLHFQLVLIHWNMLHIWKTN